MVKVLTEQVKTQIRDKKTNLIRVEGIDNPVIYKGLCSNLASLERIDIFIAKMAREKYQVFLEAGREEWTEALQYFERGKNSPFIGIKDDEYKKLSYVDFDNAITKWRNESANVPEGKTALILLIGTEAVPDMGGLADTSCVVSPNELVASLKRDYGSWFLDFLQGCTQDTKELKKAKRAIHTLYQVIFSEINVDIFKLSDFVDGLGEVPISTIQELVDYICGSLNNVWGLPIIKKRVPKVRELAEGRVKSADIVKKAIQFITKPMDTLTEGRIRAIEKKFEKYAEDQEVNIEASCPEEDSVFGSFYEFRQCVIDFLKGKNIESNRAKLIRLDYCMIDEILGTKIKGKDVVEKDKSCTVSGEPVEAFSRIFLDAVEKFGKDNESGIKTCPTRIEVKVERIKLSNYPKGQEEEALRPLCYSLGGILDFFNETGIDNGRGLLTFCYQNSNGQEAYDPFELNNFGDTKGLVSCSGRWGEPCKIQFQVTVSDEIQSSRYEYRWVFSPYSGWLHAYFYLGNLICDDTDKYVLPTLVVCSEIRSCFGCESEDEFYVQLEQLSKEERFEEHRKEIHDRFRATDTSNKFDVLCSEFKEFAERLTRCGVFAALERLRKVVSEYMALMKYIYDHHSSYTGTQKEKLSLLVNCFMLTSNSDVIENGKMEEVILPAYHPVMLEQFDARQLYIRAGFEELMNRGIEAGFDKKLGKQMEAFTQLSCITQGVDAVFLSQFKSLTCKNMWGYFGVYDMVKEEVGLDSGYSAGGLDITDDEDAAVLLKASPMSKIIVRNVLDYIKTFPARVDGLNIVFIAPVDMQNVVAAIHEIVKELDKEELPASLNVRLICMNGRKNVASYLRRWLDSYFKEEHFAKINTFLSNLTMEKETISDVLEKLLTNVDLCFHYDVLDFEGIEFDKANDEIIERDEAKFPMTFTPDAISNTPGSKRKVNISQFQFLASKWYTQASHRMGYPNSQEGMYRAFRCLELTELKKQIIEKSHECCKWVVCIDPAVDRRILETNHNKIIGFTTGEGSYGEMNVTVSARDDILNDIKNLLEKRIRERFVNWTPERLRAAASYCVDELSKDMDGSRILKALNPYDYEVHNYLAYVLTVQMLGLKKEEDSYIVRSLISLDSYQHWFSDGESDSLRPDFMLLEIPRIKENLDPEEKLHINIKLIECKMGYRKETQLIKAQQQIEKGLKTMCRNWNPKEKGMKHRYWLNQLYRAIIFSPLLISDTAPEYDNIKNKIYGILTNAIEISWESEIFAFWLDMRGEQESIKTLSSETVNELTSFGFTIKDLVCHECGQMFIQKMLLPLGYRDGEFSYNDIREEDGESLEETEEENEFEQTIQTDEEERTETEGSAGIVEEEECSGELSQTPRLCKKSLEEVRFLLGEDIRTQERYYWEFGNKELNNRHLLINGNSGCGKTYCIQTLLLEAALQGISSVVFDYTGGFANSKLEPMFKEKLRERIVQRIVKLHKIPINPFVKQVIQIDENVFVPEEDADVADKIAEIFKSVYSLGDQQRSAVYSAVLCGLRNHGEGMSFVQMVEELESIGTSYAKSVISKIQAFTDYNLFTRDEAFNWADIWDSEGTVYIIQMAGYGREIQILLTEILLWDIWSFCVKNGDETKPFVLVLDEAQNLSHGEKSPSAKILTEGRKFGISGWYATQFMKPQLSDDEIQRLQQAGQKLYFCPPDDGIMTVAKNIDITAAGAREWSERLKKLKKGECVTCGNMVRRGKWLKYDPRIIKVTSFQERCGDD